MVRPQQVDTPHAWSHFRLFALVTAGRDEGSHRFEFPALLEHVRFHLDLLVGAQAAGFAVRGIELRITSLDGESRHDRIEEQVAAPLRESFPGLDFQFDPERTAGRGYYRDACFMVNAVGADGETYFLADGGFTDWTAQLLGDRKERLLISAFGSERLCACLAPPR